ncbi:hypothetical protein [Pigmentiphaga sp. CHJ604]|uniref:hypothetical protein n=1 Tax=Pigmentiphaga sp. CHJ604 TaxID=3081984 RepID=UPI0030D5D44A
MTGREWWRTYYRLLRIARREHANAYADSAIYGTGVVVYDDKGIAQHIPMGEIYQ